MTTPTRHKKVWIRSVLGMGAAMAAASAVAIGCDSSTPTSPDGGTPDATTPDSGGNTPETGAPETSTSDVQEAGPGPSGDGGDAGDAGPSTTLYQRLGGHAGIRTAVDAVIAAELQNADIASYFFFQPGAPGNGHPTGNQVAECFTDLVGQIAGGPETYPTTLAADAGGPYTCRALAPLHGPLLISGGTFDAFITIAAGVLQANVAPADLQTIGTALIGAKPVIVTPALADAGLEPYPGDGGEALDGSLTLYQRLGGHAGVRAAVNAIVANELLNADIASYFFFQAGAPGNGHPTADQVEECFTDLVASAAGGPEQYPTTITGDAGSYTCRALGPIHAPLLISGGTFDTFVMIAGTTLAGDGGGVSAADINTLAAVLNGTRGSVVTASLNDAGLQLFPGDAGEAGASGDASGD